MKKSIRTILAPWMRQRVPQEETKARESLIKAAWQALLRENMHGLREFLFTNSLLEKKSKKTTFRYCNPVKVVL